MPTASLLTHADVRAKFPALSSGFAFLENAGGSQLPQTVIEAVSTFMVESYVQTGSGYEASRRAETVLHDAHEFLNEMFNGTGLGHVAIGPSATALTVVLANCLRPTLGPDDEIVLSVANHESNIGPWLRLADEKGCTVRWWGIDPETGLSSVDDLQNVLSPRTKIVACPMTCNLFGDILDVEAVVKAAHAVGAQVVLDAVAAASHQALDVAAWDVDFCFFSNYKVYGPHTAAMWGKADAWAALNGPNHRQLPKVGAKAFELGCLPYELLAGILGLRPYLAYVAGHDTYQGRATITAAFDRFEEWEKPLEERLVGGLTQRGDLRVFGPPAGADRHPTVSFVHRTVPSDEIVRKVHEHPIGIKGGHMYAWTACEAVGVPVSPGVVRASAVHYNTVDEIDLFLDVLDKVLP